MTSPLLSSVGSLAPGLCLLLALFLLAAGGPLQRANRYLAGFLLVLAVDMAGWATDLLPASLREILIFRLPLCFLEAPLLYVYASKLCFPPRRARPHVAAALVSAAFSAISLLPRAGAWWSGAAPALDSLSSREVDLVVNAAALHVQHYVYLALMIHLLWTYRRAYRAAYSNPDGITFAWLATVVGVSLLSHIFALLKSLAWISDHATTYHALERIIAVIAALVICALTLAALLRQHLFLGVTINASGAEDSAAPALTAEREETAAEQSPALNEAALAKLKAYMERERPFLDPGLTIRSLARRMDMGQRELSQLINQQLGVHFFDFVNRHRVETAAALLADPAHRDTTILDIAHRSGFNTKSSFNAAFAKHLGTTPTVLRLRQTTELAPT